jgi:glycosyltransferase involved in cell wall biosynthesis
MPSPYVQDLFARMAADGRLELQVLYLEQVAPDTYWGEQVMPEYAEVLPGKWYGVLGARIHWNPDIRRRIEQSDADLFVIVGYIGLTNQAAMRTLNRLNRPWVFWGEIPGLQQRGWLGNQLRAFLQRPLRKATGIAAVGTKAVHAYRKIVEPWNPQCRFANIPYHCRLDDFEAHGRSRAHSEAIRFLYCGQLIHRKGVDLLCEAFARLVTSGADVRLTFAGEGPLRVELQETMTPDVAARVTFTGFMAVDQLPEVFGAHDVFVLPSRHDGWGVVVNQAIAAGMPVIASTEVGAANDLVEEALNGFRVAPESANAIFQAMQQFVNKPEIVELFGRRSRELAGAITMDRAMDDWHNFFLSALSPPLNPTARNNTR